LKIKNIGNLFLASFLLISVFISCSDNNTATEVVSSIENTPVQKTVLPTPTVGILVPTPTIQNLDQNQPQATPQIIIDDSKQQSIQIVVEPLSKARYKIGEELVRLPLPIVATGETGLVSGTISIDEMGNVVDDSKILVDVTALKSDEDRRDRWVLRNSGIGKQVLLEVQEIVGLLNPVPNQGNYNIEIIGDLIISGVSKNTKWTTDLNFDGSEVSGLASTVITWDDFNLTKPTFPFILSLEDEITLEIEFIASLN